MKTLKICIVGNGFTGLNIARLLKKKNIPCEIFSEGLGASQFWFGTIDFLKTNHQNLRETFERFKITHPTHPYRYFTYQEVQEAFSEFFSSFPEFGYEKHHNEFENSNILTTLGNLKTCIGFWNTVFHEFELLTKTSACFLIDFEEFNNSAMPLISKSLQDKFKGSFKVLKLSLATLLSRWGIQDAIINSMNKLTEYQIADYFDKYALYDPVLAELIDSEIEIQHKNSPKNGRIYLFSPILGLTKNQEIVKYLSEQFKAPCKEVLSLSPSLMAKRFIAILEQKLLDSSIKTNRGYTLVKISKNRFSKNINWNLTFRNSSGNFMDVSSKHVILATGSMFPSSIANMEEDCIPAFKELDVEIPNTISQNLELMYSNHHDETSSIYIAGAALFNFMQDISDEEEISHNTGLGLVICSCKKIVDAICQGDFT
jgi:anaerobic glycerol-3-phosphate dehydrogenase